MNDPNSSNNIENKSQVGWWSISFDNDNLTLSDEALEIFYISDIEQGNSLIEGRLY